MINTMTPRDYYLLAAVFVVAAGCVLALYCDVQKHGNMYFWRVGKFGGSLYVKRNKLPKVTAARGRAMLRGSI